MSRVQKARLEAVERSEAKRGESSCCAKPPACPSLSLLSLIPPVHKLRLGHTLKKAAGGGWRPGSNLINEI